MNKGQISEECYEALKEAFEEDIEEKTARVEKESNVYDLYERSKEFQAAVEKLAANFGVPIGQLMEKLDKACNTFIKQTGKALENIALYYAESFNNLDEIWCVRPPAEIKKELKYEKNPMRIKQLNRELADSYRCYRRK